MTGKMLARLMLLFGASLFLLVVQSANNNNNVCPGLEHGTPPSGQEAVPDAATYDAALKALDLQAVVADLQLLMTTSQECWPADFGHYGPLFVRLAWHCSGSFRSTDGRGGCGGGRQRFEPERSWADNTNLDKARGLLWPVKEKFGDGLSWGDLFTLAGTTAIKSMGGPVTEYCAGRVDDPDGSESEILGPSPEQERDAPCEIDGKCQKPLGATTLGLIYVNPEGPVAQDEDGKWVPDPNPTRSAADIRDAFGRMGLSDEQTVALIGGGHAFGKAHGACPAGAGPSPAEQVSNPWPGLCGSGKGNETFTSGFEGQWTTEPTRWNNEFFVHLRNHNWEKHMGPGGHWQWRPTNAEEGCKVAGLMRLTVDVALVHDRKYAHIVRDFAMYPRKFDHAFDKAWFKLTTDGGYWSKERKCISGKQIPSMRSDDDGDHLAADAVELLAVQQHSSVSPIFGVSVIFMMFGFLGMAFLLNKHVFGSHAADDDQLLLHLADDDLISS
ncbi:unnamed protein product [Polarella glacialis]|uniref:Plant heme peroxidase family profile domain-containing protein n=1 Tax=Polarella glacialis TaxID=89957 RepID=A0A813DNL7_POLGL|nr:unnamed protein product [Polarella glacialis]